ncbi:TPA: RNA polymerase subunit sigma-54, partial [Enterococcus faecium]|nr:RNA polymerase subunit sigma-54 [Enterococcus faecium]NTN74107.1 RNA polymerase subunit sigma-54 [Enterococcus faecium]HAX1009268.1 RNA polymerase subunit sigma-54 [Enterococcus faecium]HCR3958723.1 RNA polymerase subunit sigma-54 [Enterococcus faecium]HDL2438314.1 RNA polymerase subunit sigma-54 [Enterococcus faecium]
NEHLKEGAQLFDTFLNVSKDFFSEIKDIYCIEIPKGEYELIYTIFEQTIF